VVSLCRRLILPCIHSFTQGSNDAAEVRGSFQETAPRKTAENTTVVVTTLILTEKACLVQIPHHTAYKATKYGFNFYVYFEL